MLELPRFVQIEPVGQCNLRCQMCPIAFRQDAPEGAPAFMKFEDFTRLIDQFPQLAELHLQGLGEPMMHPRFFDMIRYAAARGVKVTTNSNLTLLTERRAKLCVTSGLDSLHISIDGATAETYERIRIKSKFARVTRNLEMVLATRRELKSPTPRIQLVFVVMRQNLHELPALIRLARDWEIETVFVQHLCHDFGEETLPAHYRTMRDFVEAETLLNEDLARIEDYFSQARKVADELDVRLRLPRARPQKYSAETKGRERCDWPWRGAYISFQGLAMPCCMIATPDRFNFGSMIERGAEAVWSGEDYEQFRRQLESDDPPAICRSCAVYHGTF